MGADRAQDNEGARHSDCIPIISVAPGKYCMARHTKSFSRMGD